MVAVWFLMKEGGVEATESFLHKEHTESVNQGFMQEKTGYIRNSYEGLIMRIFLKNVQPGMILGEDVYARDRMVLAAGTELTEGAIEKLSMLRIRDIQVMSEGDRAAQQAEENGENKESLAAGEQTGEGDVASDGASLFVTSDYLDEDLDLVPPLSAEYRSRIKASQEFMVFKAQYDQSIDEFMDVLNDIIKRNQPTTVDEMFTPAIDQLLINARSESTNTFDMLANIEQYDQITYQHSLNVALLTSMLASWLGMNPEQVKLATACGMVHDVGKLAIPEEIIKKPGKLTAEEYAIVKTHTIQGYEFLKKYYANKNILAAALMHHEKFDGTGYPHGLPGERINPYARLVAITDVYDALASARSYRPALCPFKVIEIFEKEGLDKYDPRIVRMFLGNVARSYLNEKVRLSDGREARVILINEDWLSRPLVQTEDEMVELSDEENLTIEAIL